MSNLKNTLSKLTVRIFIATIVFFAIWLFVVGITYLIFYVITKRTANRFVSQYPLLFSQVFRAIIIGLNLWSLWDCIDIWFKSWFLLNPP